MNFLLINSNRESSFIAALIKGSVIVKYTSDYLNKDEKTAFLKSPDKLVHCLKYITDNIKSRGLSLFEIDAVSVIIGPGSFTGIRVGIAIAKGFADSLTKKIIPINNFELISKQAEGKIHTQKYCILIPAKLPEFYYALFEKNLEIERGCVQLDEFSLKFDKNTTLVGNFNDDYKKNLGYFSIPCKNLGNQELQAMIELSKKKFLSGLIYDSGKIEPLYLKDFAFKITHSSNEQKN